MLMIGMCRSITGVHTASQALHLSAGSAAPCTALQSDSSRSRHSALGSRDRVDLTAISAGRRRSRLRTVSATMMSWSLQLHGMTVADVTASVDRTIMWSSSVPDTGRVGSVTNCLTLTSSPGRIVGRHTLLVAANQNSHRPERTAVCRYHTHALIGPANHLEHWTQLHWAACI